MKRLLIVFTAAMVWIPLAGALAQSGPVAEACKADMQKHCADKKHDGEVRACLMQQKDKVTPACKSALETTRGGRRRKAPN